MASSQMTGLQVIPLSDIKIGPDLGRGAYGRVFKVKYLGAYYAAKQIHSLLLEATGREGRSMIVDSFMHEIRLCNSLSHPNILCSIEVYSMHINNQMYQLCLWN